MFEHLNNVQIQHNAVILSTDKSWKYLQMLLFVKMLKYYWIYVKLLLEIIQHVWQKVLKFLIVTL